MAIVQISAVAEFRDISFLQGQKSLKIDSDTENILINHIPTKKHTLTKLRFGLWEKSPLSPPRKKKNKFLEFMAYGLGLRRNYLGIDGGVKNPAFDCDISLGRLVNEQGNRHFE